MIFTGWVPGQWHPRRGAAPVRGGPWGSRGDRRHPCPDRRGRSRPTWGLEWIRGAGKPHRWRLGTLVEGRWARQGLAEADCRAVEGQGVARRGAMGTVCRVVEGRGVARQGAGEMVRRAVEGQGEARRGAEDTAEDRQWVEGRAAARPEAEAEDRRWVEGQAAARPAAEAEGHRWVEGQGAARLEVADGDSQAAAGGTGCRAAGDRDLAEVAAARHRDRHRRPRLADPIREQVWVHPKGAAEDAWECRM
jgi:hypothetical protein